MIDWRVVPSMYDDVTQREGFLNGIIVCVAACTKGGDTDLLVELTFPGRFRMHEANNLNDAETFVLAQLAWFVRWAGIVNGPVGEGEPLLVVTGGWNRYRGFEEPANVWERHAGNYRVHDHSVETAKAVIVERNQMLLLRPPINYTGIDRRLWEQGPHVYEEMK